LQDHRPLALGDENTSRTGSILWCMPEQRADREPAESV
jgi:hypothetical protein